MNTKERTLVNWTGEEFQMIKVGLPFYHPGVNLEEGAYAEFVKLGLMLTIQVRNPTKEEIHEVNEGNIKMAIIPVGEILFIETKLGKMEWMDMPYHIALSQIRGVDEPKIPMGGIIKIPEPPQGLGYACHIFLVDISTGILAAYRVIGLDNKFSTLLRDYILWQDSLYSDIKFDKKTYNGAIDLIFRKYRQGQLIKLADEIF